MKSVNCALARIRIIFCILVNEGAKGENNHLAEEVNLLIKSSFLISPGSIENYLKEIADPPPLPEYIIKTGPYLNSKKGGVHQIIILYKFDKSNFAEAWDKISRQLDSFRGLPGFTASAHIYGPRPYHLTLEKDDRIKKYPDMSPMPPPAWAKNCLGY